MQDRRVHVSRFVCGTVEANLKALAAEVDTAAARGADLCVFPESFLHGYTRSVDPEQVRQLLTTLSHRHPALLLVAGSFTEDGRNRMTVWKHGQEQARYDKVHLFAPNQEARLWTPGTAYVTVQDGPWTLGLLNCNDLRFPEQARALRLQGGANLLVVVAWWPWRRTAVFEALLRARAIENACFVVGCCIAASTLPEEPFHGAGNYVFDPLGQPVATPDDASYLLEAGCFESVLVTPEAGVRTVDGVSRVTITDGSPPFTDSRPLST